MNQFDVPMSDADINMTSNPARAMLDEKLATTGESNGWFWTALGIGASIYGSSKQASAARSEAEARNQAIEMQYEYDMELYDMKKQQLQANQDFKIEEIQNAARQEGQIAAFKDASNLRQYNYNLQIRNAQQETNEKMSHNEIVGNIIFFLIAGHETTSNTISWMIYLLAKHQHSMKTILFTRKIQQNIAF